MVKVKRCNVCGLSKRITEFYKERSCKDGYSCQCKKCRRKVMKIWEKNNPEKNRINSKRSYWRNVEKSRRLSRKNAKR